MQKSTKSITQILKFALVSFTVTAIQLILVNLFVYLMKDWKTPVSGFLTLFFNENSVGAGNMNWGFIMPFLLSNLLANIYGYYRNRKYTFRSDPPKRNLYIYIGIILILILVSTWLQGVTVHYLHGFEHSVIHASAASIAAMLAGWLQFVILFPLEKYWLLK